MRNWRSNKYFLTWNYHLIEENYVKTFICKELRILESTKNKKGVSSLRYSVYCWEVGKVNKRPHCHIWLHFRNARSFLSVQRLFTRCNIEKGKGNDDQAAKYCKKDGRFEEIGHPTCQGERTDLRILVGQIASGETCCSKIIREEALTYHMYGRTLEKAEDLFQRDVFRSIPTKGIWLYGGTGTGKSSYAFNGYDPRTHYNKCLGDGDSRWWDGYVGQRTIIIDEFRGELSFSFILKLIDRWPLNLPRRNREPTPCLAEEVIITSCYHPHYIYKDETQKNMKQLYRRCTIKVCYLWKCASCLVCDKDGPVNRDNISNYEIFN